jgi:ABC-type Na+ transport system ATPase subunit NatA
MNQGSSANQVVTTEPIVVVEDLVKVYPGGTRAVDGIGFTVAPGEFFGFLGPNGAGKSTTLKVLSITTRRVLSSSLQTPLQGVWVRGSRRINRGHAPHAQRRKEGRP